MIKGFKRAYKFSEFIDECMIPDKELTLSRFQNKIYVGCFFRVSNDIGWVYENVCLDKLSNHHNF